MSAMIRMQVTVMFKELLDYEDEFHLLYLGKLTKREGWKNVREHGVTQLLGAKVLGALLGLTDGERRALESVAIIHDWEKRLDNFPDDFSPAEKEKIELYYKKIKPDERLMAATGPDFLEKVLYAEVSILEFLQFYLDDITMGSEIVPFDKRIEEVSTRKQYLNDDGDLTQRLGGRKYWELEMEVGHLVENMIFDSLKARGVEIGSPKDIPYLIKNKIIELSNV